MLIDGGVAINLMPYFIFKKFGREDDGLMKTNLMPNGVCVCGGGGQSDGGSGSRLHGAYHRVLVACYRILHHRGAM
jgi:hypothetical protein